MTFSNNIQSFYGFQTHTVLFQRLSLVLNIRCLIFLYFGDSLGLYPKRRSVDIQNGEPYKNDMKIKLFEVSHMNVKRQNHLIDIRHSSDER